MSVHIFLGPTLSWRDAESMLKAEYLPPVSQGDVLRSVQQGARVIGIVDGYFSRVPAVWHKEILWAMSHGVQVYGSASMGALRAAELAPFGMIGLGRIFVAYRDGVLEDDDEVALIHGDESSGFIAISEAMVNVRATLSRAVAEEIVREATRAAVLDVAKTLHYSQRAYSRIIREASGTGLQEGELKALRTWLPSGRVNQKRDDAIEMLQAIREAAPQPEEPGSVRFHFAHTDLWDHVLRTAADDVEAQSMAR